jgi:hypothetical protein
VSFGRGARRSHPDKIAAATPAHEHPAVKRALAAASLPTAVDLGQYSPMILDQGPTGSCTAHAIAGGIVVGLASQGSPLGFVPSPRLTYASTRARERALAAVGAPTLPTLTDSGAEIADVMAVIASDGVRPMQAPTSDGRYSDIEPANVNSEPAVLDIEIAAAHVLDGPYAVDLTAASAWNVMKAALAAGLEIDIAFFADTAFENLQSGQVAGAPDTSDPNGGGHSVRLSGYTADGNAILTNSWGSSWCNAGRCLVGPAFIAAIWEAWVVSVKPEVA